MTTDSVEPNSMHQAVWKSTVAIFEPTTSGRATTANYATC